MRMWKRSAWIIAALTVGFPVQAQDPLLNPSSMSIEQLMQVEVTSVSKKEEKLSRTASAVFVITQADIRRSGATNIPDLLRMVPGLDVAQANSSTWAISSRGFNDQAANKLLVLIDGRTVYSPLFGGVFWDAQQIPVETIDRIEVIRGPGAAVWGANAVNGVINITTKKASDTQGELISGGGGTYEHGFGTALYGGKMGSDTYYRVFMNAFNRNHFNGFTGQNGHDDWDMYRTGFRVDSKLGAKDSITVQGDAYNGSEAEVVAAVTSFQQPQPQILNLRQGLGGWDVLSRWDRAISSTSQTALQVYFDRTNRGDPTYGEGRDTLDFDFENHIAWGSRQDFVWGLGYRTTSDNIRGSIRVSFNPPSETDQLFSSFVQDEIAIVRERLYLTLGSKFEHNHFTGFGLQPNARLAWVVNDKNMFWAAVSRALQTPSRDSEVRFNESVSTGPSGLPLVVSVFGGEDENEILLAEEIGYRTQVSDHLSMDLTSFYNSYTDLTSAELGTLFMESNPAPTHWVLPFTSANLLHGESHGGEIALNWKPTNRWILNPGYSYLQLHIHRAPTSTDARSVITIEGSSPREQAQLCSHLELAPRWEWDTSVYFVGRLAALQIPSYTRLDAGLTWKFGEKMSFGVVGQNLLHDHHLESDSSDQIVVSSLVKRSAYAKLTWQF
ncbi:MAG TPA: TonB-dependent receptor [Candidatus Acidoferrales bacterium]|nr:TonB-dependent receptor [Candidatus Acidoferrales bacterium]